jgi:hypothetical protein
MHLIGMNNLLILLSLGPGYPIPGARISHEATTLTNLCVELKDEAAAVRGRVAPLEEEVRQLQEDLRQRSVNEMSLDTKPPRLLAKTPRLLFALLPCEGSGGRAVGNRRP